MNNLQPSIQAPAKLDSFHQTQKHMPFQKFPLLILALFTAVSLSAQPDLPPKAEDISPLLIGETLPNLPVYSMDNVATNLGDILSKPTVLVFYRGSWCPYCNVPLSELAKIEADVLKLGYQIVAISPDDFQ